MMRKKISIFIFVFMMLSNIHVVSAATASYSLNGKTTVTVGNKVTVTFSVSGENMYMVKGVINSSNASVLSGSKSIYKKADLAEEKPFSSLTSSITFTAQKPGTATISFSPHSDNCIDVYNSPLSMQGSSLTIRVIEKSSSSNGSSSNSSASNNGSSSNNSGSTANSSNNQNENQENKTEEKEAKKSSVNTLSSLSVSEGTLSPQFSSSTTNYSVKLSAEQTKISVSAKAKDSKAKVSGTGSHSLKAGENTIKVKCTAEDGSVKTYTITAYVDEKPTVYTEFNDQKLGVVRDLDGVEGPNKSFEGTKVTLDGQEVQGWKSEQLGKTVVYLVDENNEEGYYLVEDGKITSQLESVSFAGINMYIVDIPQDKQNIEGMQFKELTIENQKIPGWVFENEKLSNYELIYVMLENGDYTYYMHEKNDNTFMKYSEEFIEVPEKIENTKEELKDTNTLTMIFIGTTIIFAVSTISLAIIYINFKKKSISAVKEYYDRKYGNDDE